MKNLYLRPDIEVCNLELEGFLCASGDDSECHIHYGVQVNEFEEYTSTENIGDIIL